MELRFGDRDRLLIDDAKMIFKNFDGRKTDYNNAGDRNFNLVIPTEEMANALLENKNKDGASWKVNIKPGKEEGELYIKLRVNVNFDSNRPPVIRLVTGGRVRTLNEKTVALLDDMDISTVNMDIVPYDHIAKDGTPHRTAYLASMEVFQNLDRFDDKYNEVEEDEDIPF